MANEEIRSTLHHLDCNLLLNVRHTFGVDPGGHYCTDSRRNIGIRPLTRDEIPQDDPYLVNKLWAICLQCPVLANTLANSGKDLADIPRNLIISS